MNIENKEKFKFWYVECKICKNLNPEFQKCKKALWKPPSTYGVCDYYLKTL